MKENITVGRNIREARAEKGLTQRALSEAAEISQTQLSDYENGKKDPGLFTLAKISKVLGKTIDELYYGDAAVSCITSAPDKGRLIANCIYQLWSQGVIEQHIPSEDEKRYLDSYRQRPVVDLRDHYWAVQRLLETLDDFKSKKYTYKNPDLYLEQVLDSVAREIGA